MTDKAEGWAGQIAGATLAELAASPAFARWYDDPHGAWPLVRLPDADAQALGAREGVRVARLSEETALKQRREHPELLAHDYAMSQDVIERATLKVQDGSSLIYVQEVPGGESGGHVLVIKATRTGKALFVTSLRRLSRRQAERDAEISRLLKKGNKG
ncbi:MAG: hypothetical protein J0I72_00555 [Stenotrophomonas sp.]|nr:hypothetical protein [Xanthomonadales bacterium]MBN8767829.1 hypothetical protein [Stenotrophomonas sp.]